jgi:hypothetical protein
MLPDRQFKMLVYKLKSIDIRIMINWCFFDDLNFGLDGLNKHDICKRFALFNLYKPTFIISFNIFNF